MTVDAFQLRVAAGLPTGAIRLPRVLTADEAAALQVAWERDGASAVLPAPDMESVPFVRVPARVMVAGDIETERAASVSAAPHAFYGAAGIDPEPVASRRVTDIGRARLLATAVDVVAGSLAIDDRLVDISRALLRGLAFIEVVPAREEYDEPKEVLRSLAEWDAAKMYDELRRLEGTPSAAIVSALAAFADLSRLVRCGAEVPYLECECPTTKATFEVRTITGPDLVVACSSCDGSHRLGEIKLFLSKDEDGLGRGFRWEGGLYFAGMQIVTSESALETTAERLFPESKNRSRRIHKKLVKRHGGEFQTRPAAFDVKGRLFMHPAMWARLQAEFEMRVAR